MTRPLPPDPREVLAGALAAAERGWRVFPLVPGTKRPLWKAWATHATNEADVIRSWPGWAPGGRRGGRGRCDNVGIACGPSRLVVLDLDRPKPGPDGALVGPPPQWDLPGITDGASALTHLAAAAGEQVPGTHEVTTRTSGRHLYFTAPSDGTVITNSRGKVAWLVDVRAPGHPGGDGGYVVGVGSFVDADDNGPAGPYATARDLAALALPAWLTRALAACTSTPEPEWWASVPGGPDGAFDPADLSRGGSGPQAQGLALARRGSPMPGVRCPGAYATRCLDNAVAQLRAAVPGAAGGEGRNDTLNRVAFTLGRLAGAGLLHPDLITARLAAVAGEIGLSQRETHRSIASGLNAGMKHPRRTA